MENKEIVTVIDGVGSVEVMNDLAHFSLNIRSKADTLNKAIGATKERADMAIKMLGDLQERGMKLSGEIANIVSNYKLEHREGNERIGAGFVSMGNISWVAEVDDNLDNIYKTCLKFDPEMKAPYFSVKDAATHKSLALEHSVEDATEKLAKECRLLGVDVGSLKIKNWTFNYDGSMNTNSYGGKSSYMGAQGIMGATGATGLMGSTGNQLDNITRSMAMKVGSIYQEPLDIKIMPGTVMFRVAVRINYVWA